MKIYTEVNYEFKDGFLVELSSKFYNYEGEIADCKSSGAEIVSHTAKKTKEGIEYLEQKTDEGSDFVDTQTQSIQEGPKGDFKNIVDQLYGGSLKAGVEHVQKQYRDTEDDVNEVINKAKTYLGGIQSLADEDDDDDTTTTTDTTTDTTPEERESLLTQGVVDEGGRKAKYGRRAMSTGTLSGSILAP
ncbi:MAG TPA: hypothetical protein EYO81_02770 [Gammaproteobacteria bacterium]|nr:hypothetical protein [Gammaproteobacteria bacterium]